MPIEREEGGRPLAVKAAAAAVGAAAGIAGPDAAVIGAGLTPVIEEFLGRLYSGMTARRVERVAETLNDAAEELGGDVAEQLGRFADAAASDETYQELLARTLTIAQDTAMRDKRRSLGRALANALDDTGTKVDGEIAFIRMLADLDPVHIRVLKIMSRRPKHLDKVAVQMNAADDPKAARQWYQWSIAEADPGLEEAVYGALRILERHGGEQPVPLLTACSMSTRSRPMATISSTGWPHLTGMTARGQHDGYRSAGRHRAHRRGGRDARVLGR